MKNTLRQNVGTLDRAIRFLLGLSLILYPVMASWTLWGTAFSAAFGGVFVVEALIRYCLAYDFLGWSTVENERVP